MIVIDGGEIIFDGALGAIIERFGGSGRILTLEFTGRDGNRDFAGLGEVVERTDATVKLRVPHAEVAAVVRRLFEAYPVRDISVQEVPIEEVIGRLFGQTGESANGLRD